MKLYIIRHGQTDWNKENIIQGSEDNLLNETGISQSDAAGNYLSEERFSALITSPLTRTKETGAHILSKNKRTSKTEILDQHHYVYKGFSERDFGEVSGKHVQEFKKITFGVSDIEEDEAFISRIGMDFIRMMDFLSKTYTNDASILIVTHSHMIKALFHHLNPINYKIHKNPLVNCSVSVIHVDMDLYSQGTLWTKCIDIASYNIDPLHITS